jgi:hypothetical protein
VVKVVPYVSSVTETNVCFLFILFNSKQPAPTRLLLLPAAVVTTTVNRTHRQHHNKRSLSHYELHTQVMKSQCTSVSRIILLVVATSLIGQLPLSVHGGIVCSLLGAPPCFMGLGSIMHRGTPGEPDCQETCVFFFFAILNFFQGYTCDGCNSFRIKLYWEEGYNWQEEWIERKWCLECSSGRCGTDVDIVIRKCDSDTTRFEFVDSGDGQQVQVKVAGQDNLCLELMESNNRDIKLQNCVTGSRRQLFTAGPGDFNGDRFELQNVQIAGCLSNPHHPYDGELIRRQNCTGARIDTRFGYLKTVFLERRPETRTQSRLSKKTVFVQPAKKRRNPLPRSVWDRAKRLQQNQQQQATTTAATENNEAVSIMPHQHLSLPLQDATNVQQVINILAITGHRGCPTASAAIITWQLLSALGLTPCLWFFVALGQLRMPTTRRPVADCYQPQLIAQRLNYQSSSLGRCRRRHLFVAVTEDVSRMTRRHVGCCGRRPCMQVNSN